MENILRNSLIHMVKQADTPIILTDESLQVLACSMPFYHSVVSFNDDIRSLFDSNTRQRIKRCRKTGCSMKTRAKIAPIMLNMNINWLCIGENEAYMIGIVESNHLIDANQGLTIAYSCADHVATASAMMLESLQNIHKRQAITPIETQLLVDDVRRINRSHINLKLSLDTLTDSLILHKKDNDITRVVRLSAQRFQDEMKMRNIRITTSLPKLTCFSPCDLKYFTIAIADCLACMMYFTQDNHTISIELKNQYPHHEIIFHDPVFQIPEQYTDSLFIGDVKIPGKTNTVKLYFANTIIRKHDGMLSIDQSEKIGYRIRLSIPASPSNHLVFEDIDDTNITQRILHYLNIAATDL
jgi:hypothetical protein